MKILHLITHYYPHVYGAENFAQHLAEYQAKKHDIYLITGRWQKKWKQYEVINKVKVYRETVLKIRYLQTVLAITPFFARAKKLIKEQNIKMIHAHIFPSLIVGALLKTKNTKLIVTIQGGDLADYDEVFGPFKFIFKPIIAFCLKRADKVHCVSQYLARKVKDLGVSKNKIIIIPNGIDTKLFKAKKQKYRKEIKLITTSRLEKKNNIINLVKIISELKDKYSLSLDVYGKGSLEYEIKKLIKKLRVKKTIKLKGYTKQEQLSKILPNYDYFIRLSTQEGFGISFIEAMACGLIPIASNVGGIVDFIKHNKTGFLIDLEKNVNSQIEKVFSSKHTKAIRKLATSSIIKNYAWQKVLKKTDSLYL